MSEPCRSRGAEDQGAKNDNREVKNARVLAHKSGHWSILMILEDGTFRKLDMRIHPEDDSTTKGELCWDILPKHYYDEDWYHANSWDFKMAAKVRVRHVYLHVQKRRLHEYNFEKVGDDYVGCRYWVYTVLTLFGKKGFLEKEAGNYIAKKLKHPEAIGDTNKEKLRGNFSYPDTTDPPAPPSS